MYSDFCKVQLGAKSILHAHISKNIIEGATLKAAHAPSTFDDVATILKVNDGQEHSFWHGLVSYVKKYPLKVYDINMF